MRQEMEGKGGRNPALTQEERNHRNNPENIGKND